MASQGAARGALLRPPIASLPQCGRPTAPRGLAPAILEGLSHLARRALVGEHATGLQQCLLHWRRLVHQDDLEAHRQRLGRRCADRTPQLVLQPSEDPEAGRRSFALRRRHRRCCRRGRRGAARWRRLAFHRVGPRARREVGAVISLGLHIANWHWSGHVRCRRTGYVLQLGFCQGRTVIGIGCVLLQEIRVHRPTEERANAERVAEPHRGLAARRDLQHGRPAGGSERLPVFRGAAGWAAELRCQEELIHSAELQGRLALRLPIAVARAFRFGQQRELQEALGHRVHLATLLRRSGARGGRGGAAQPVKVRGAGEVDAAEHPPAEPLGQLGQQLPLHVRLASEDEAAHVCEEAGRHLRRFAEEGELRLLPQPRVAQRRLSPPARAGGRCRGDVPELGDLRGRAREGPEAPHRPESSLCTVDGDGSVGGPLLRLHRCPQHGGVEAAAATVHAAPQRHWRMHNLRQLLGAEHHEAVRVVLAGQALPQGSCPAQRPLDRQAIKPETGCWQHPRSPRASVGPPPRRRTPAGRR
mmetsp:Transcript_58010/g.130416  ORF Transcript_58010/g.130416 Transcript_58010/m.130416 type:complete len:530 (+) Transcript_58010:178-1767(+)